MSRIYRTIRDVFLGFALQISMALCTFIAVLKLIAEKIKLRINYSFLSLGSLATDLRRQFHRRAFETHLQFNPRMNSKLLVLTSPLAFILKIKTKGGGVKGNLYFDNEICRGLSSESSYKKVNVTLILNTDKVVRFFSEDGKVHNLNKFFHSKQVVNFVSIKHL